MKEEEVGHELLQGEDELYGFNLSHAFPRVLARWEGITGCTNVMQELPH